MRYNIPVFSRRVFRDIVGEGNSYLDTVAHPLLKALNIFDGPPCSAAAAAILPGLRHISGSIPYIFLSMDEQIL